MTLHSAKAFPPAVIPRPVCELLRVHPTRLGQHTQLRLDPRGHGVKSSHGIVNGDPKWPAAGSVDTEIGCFREPEASDAEAQVQSRVQDRGGPLGA